MAELHLRRRGRRWFGAHVIRDADLGVLLFRLIEEVENPFRAGHSGLQRVVHPRQLGQRLIELAHIDDERLNAAEADLAGGDLQPADHRDGDVGEVADEPRGRRDQPGEQLGAETGAVELVVAPVELRAGGIAVPERAHHGEPAVGLLDVGAQRPVATHCAANSRRERRVTVRTVSSDSGTASTVMPANSGEIDTIIASTATTVNTAVSSWLIVIDTETEMLSTSLVTRLSSSPRWRVST